MCVSEGESFNPISMPSINRRPSKKFLKNNEVLSCAKQLGKLDCGDTIVVIDLKIPHKFISTGIASDIASASFAK